MLTPARLFYLLLSLTIFLLARCANPVSPQGGPKDEAPPKVISCDPPPKSVHFSQKDFEVEFDEFIALKNPLTEIYISPRMLKPPDTRLRGKSLIVGFDDTLAANTTYSVMFGNAITDITEGNVLKEFSYVFSTGSWLDSLSLKGNILSAFDHSPQKEIFVGLYIHNTDTIPFDSMPLKVAPYYLTRTNDKGFFRFSNLRPAPYRLFAIADQNSDLIFNQPTEKIAYLDSIIQPFFMKEPKSDTLAAADSLASPDSSMRADTSQHLSPQSPERYPDLTLFLFLEEDTIQRLVKSIFPVAEMALLVFRQPAIDLNITPLNFDSAASWFIPEYSANRDSVTLWITRPETDTLLLKISARDLDTDTLELALPVRESKANRTGKDRPPAIRITAPPMGSAINQFKNKLILTWSSPLTQADFSRTLLIREKDTLKPTVFFSDSLHRKICIEYPWNEETGYTLLFPDSIFTGIQGLSHDTILFGVRTRAEKDFGNLNLMFNQPEYAGDYIVQLLNEKESVVYEQHVVRSPGLIRFKFMAPGKYKLKAIRDQNRNGKWDTGNYRKMIQPEEVLYLPKTVEIRANWDIEEAWN